MLKLFTVFFAISLTTIGSAMAGPFDDLKTYNRADYSREITQCNILAAHADDPEHISEGISQDNMDKPAAIKA